MLIRTLTIGHRYIPPDQIANGLPLDDGRPPHACDFLAQAYLPRCFWFEVVECIRRLMLSSALLFFNPGSNSQVRKREERGDSTLVTCLTPSCFHSRLS